MTMKTSLLFTLTPIFYISFLSSCEHSKPTSTPLQSKRTETCSDYIQKIEQIDSVNLNETQILTLKGYVADGCGAAAQRLYIYYTFKGGDAALGLEWMKIGANLKDPQCVMQFAKQLWTSRQEESVSQILKMFKYAEDNGISGARDWIKTVELGSRHFLTH